MPAAFSSAEAGKGVKACPFHKRGTCRDGKDCAMMHTGKPGAGGSSKGGSPNPPSQHGAHKEAPTENRERQL